MDQRYRDTIDAASAGLAQALLDDIPALLEHGLRLDALVREPPACRRPCFAPCSLSGPVCPFGSASHPSWPHGPEPAHGAVQDLVWRVRDGSIGILSVLFHRDPLGRTERGADVWFGTRAMGAQMG
jgi:hypothetical protein